MANYYDSDGETLVDDDRYRRPRRPQTTYRSPSVDTRRTRQSYYSQRSGDHKSGSSKYETLSKFALVLGVIQLIGGIIHIIHEEKSKEKEREYRRQKRRAFERAKERRRREEEKRERDEDVGYDDEYDRSREVKRITYAPARSHSTSSSQSESDRKIERPPSRSDRASRRSSVAGSRYERDGRARSRMR